MKNMFLSLLFLTILILCEVDAAPNIKYKRFYKGLGLDDMSPDSNKMTRDELGSIMYSSGIKEEIIPLFVDRIFKLNDWNEDNVLDEIELRGR